MRILKIKRLAFILGVLLTAAALAACASLPVVQIQNEKLTLIGTETSDRYEGVFPAEGNQILAVRFLAENKNPDLTAIAEGFFGTTPCTLSIGGDTYDCRSIAFEQENGQLIALPLFEVPATLPENAALTLSGDAFSPVQFSL